MRRIIKFIWLLSVVVFLAMLLWVYAYLPNRVGVMADYEGIADTFVSKGNFFYLALGLFLLVNGALFVMRRLLVPGDFSTPKTPASVARAGLRADLADWMLGFAAALNFFFILAMSYLSVFNNPESGNVNFYGVLVGAGPVLVALMLLVLVYLFFKKR
jgi:hypothetical protein